MRNCSVANVGILVGWLVGVGSAHAVFESEPERETVYRSWDDSNARSPRVAVPRAACHGSDASGARPEHRVFEWPVVRRCSARRGYPARCPGGKLPESCARGAFTCTAMPFQAAFALTDRSAALGFAEASLAGAWRHGQANDAAITVAVDSRREYVCVVAQCHSTPSPSSSRKA